MLDSQCRLAIDSIDHKQRDQILNRLSDYSEEACRRFADMALNADTIHTRKQALINLGLLECKNARDAIMAGLQDNHSEIAMAAALSIGLYDDPDFLKAAERCLEFHRFALVRIACRQFIDSLKQRARRNKHSLHMNLNNGVDGKKIGWIS
jgi:hypothetical protein